MSFKVIMPQSGQDIEYGKVVRWLKNEGDPLAKGEVICEIETEKAVFEVEAPGEGYLRKIVVGEDEQVPILSVIAYIGELDEEIVFDETIVSPQDVIDTSESIGPPGVGISSHVKRLAEEKGVPLELVRGSGAWGRVTEKDVLKFVEDQIKDAGAPIKYSVSGGKVVPMSKIRKVTARKMQQSKQSVPHFYVTLAVDMTEALQFLNEFNRDLDHPETSSISVTDLIARACVLAFQQHPELNSSAMDDDKIVLWASLNIGLAIAENTELVVPVIEHIDRLSLGDIARERHVLIEKTKEGKQPSLSPARFTISNLGMFSVDNFLAIINPPETAILAVSTVEKRPVALDEHNIGLRDMLNMTLSIDHRVADGVTACNFMNNIKDLLEDPKKLL